MLRHSIGINLTKNSYVAQWTEIFGCMVANALVNYSRYDRSAVVALLYVCHPINDPSFSPSVPAYWRMP